MKILVTAKTQAHSFECHPGEKILHAGLRSGIALPYECGTGTCGTCKARLLEGEVHDEWPEAPGRSALREGEVLMCQCVARTNAALEVKVDVKPMAPETCLPGALAGTIRSRTMLTHDVATLRLGVSRPVVFDAGQFMLMTAPGVTGARAYSMVNYESKAEHLVFVAKQKPAGRMSEWLFGPAIEGTRVGLFGPLGVATFRPDLDRNLLCIAGGSGIAGMMSILTCAARERYFDRHAGHVFFGVRTPRDAFFLDELAALKGRAAPHALAVTLALSDEGVDPALQARYPQLAFDTGLVHAVASRHMQGKFHDVRAYAAGPPPMVEATLRMLVVDGRLRANDIRYDKFS
jgi:toluene monooxygenase electron transfer component